MSMHVRSFIWDGDPKFCLQYGGNGLDTATTIDSSLVSPDPNYPLYVHFNIGQNAGLVAGVSLTGYTSGAVIKVGHVVTTQGASASSDMMGILFYRKVSGKIVSGELLKVAATTYCATTSVEADTPMTRAESIYIVVESNTIRYCVGGPTPTNTAATPANFGIPLTAGQNIVLSSDQSISSFSMINANSANNATVNMVVNF